MSIPDKNSSVPDSLKYSQFIKDTQSTIIENKDKPKEDTLELLFQSAQYKEMQFLQTSRAKGICFLSILPFLPIMYLVSIFASEAVNNNDPRIGFGVIVYFIVTMTLGWKFGTYKALKEIEQQTVD